MHHYLERGSLLALKPVIVHRLDQQCVMSRREIGVGDMVDARLGRLPRVIESVELLGIDRFLGQHVIVGGKVDSDIPESVAQVNPARTVDSQVGDYASARFLPRPHLIAVKAQRGKHHLGGYAVELNLGGQEVIYAIEATHQHLARGEQGERALVEIAVLQAVVCDRPSGR